MKDTELWADLVQELVRQVRREVEGLSEDELTWQPAPASNHIAQTVWHFTRWLDVMVVQAFENKPSDEEQWFTRGWASKTGYDPRGIGYGGFGTITGYTWQEAEAVPVLSAADLIAYLEQASQALRKHLLAMLDGALVQPILGLDHKESPHDWLKDILTGSFRHVGEIQTLKAIRQRTRKPMTQ
jgi:hypothetical protein